MKKALAFALFLLFLVPGVAHASGLTYNANNQLISFIAPNPPNTTEILAGANASTPSFRYSNVITIGGTPIDALISIVALQNSESNNLTNDGLMDRVDDNDTNPLIETTFRNAVATPGLGFATYDIQFVLGGTSTPVILENVAVTVRDVDNNQFVEFSGLTSYVLAASRSSAQIAAYTGNASITTTTTTVNTVVPSGSVLFFASGPSSGSDPAADQQKHWVEAKFADTSTLRVKLGSYEVGSANFDLDFQTAVFTTPVDNPVTVTQPSFTVSYDANSGSGTAPTATSGTGTLTVAGNTGSPALTKAGFVFSGWNTRADGTGATYVAGESMLPVANTTLFAMWTAAPAPEPELAKTGDSSSGVILPLIASAGLVIGFGALMAARKKRTI